MPGDQLGVFFFKTSEMHLGSLNPACDADVTFGQSCSQQSDTCQKDFFCNRYDRYMHFSEPASMNARFNLDPRIGLTRPG